MRRGHGGGFHRNQSLDSSGPDVKLRGTAHQIFERYQILARDANAAGDRIAAENYLQHAEHYFRMMVAAGGAPQPRGNGHLVDDDQQPQPDTDEESPPPPPVT
jgi:hypothetical protein